MEHKRLTEAICRIGRWAIAIALAWIGHAPTFASQIILASHVDTAVPRHPALLRLLYDVGSGLQARCRMASGPMPSPLLMGNRLLKNGNDCR